MNYSYEHELLEIMKDFNLKYYNKKCGVHFTSEDNLFNMIKGGQIYLSDIFHTNDMDEIDFGKQVILAYFTDNYDNNLIKINRLFNLKENLNKRIFTLCLTDSINDDNLLHWGIYSNNFKGVCVHININVMLKIVEENYGNNIIKYVIPIQYFNEKYVNVTTDELKIEDFIENISAILYRLYQKIDLEERSVDTKKNIMLFKDIFFLFSSMIKKYFWRNEEEIRIAIFPSSNSMIKMDPCCNKLILPIKFIDQHNRDELLRFKHEHNNFSLIRKNEKKIYKGKLFDRIRLGPKNQSYDLEKILHFLNEYDLDLAVFHSSGNYNK